MFAQWPVETGLLLGSGKRAQFGERGGRRTVVPSLPFVLIILSSCAAFTPYLFRHHCGRTNKCRGEHNEAVVGAIHSPLGYGGLTCTATGGVADPRHRWGRIHQ